MIYKTLYMKWFATIDNWRISMHRLNGTVRLSFVTVVTLIFFLSFFNDLESNGRVPSLLAEQ